MKASLDTLAIAIFAAMLAVVTVVGPGSASAPRAWGWW